MIFDKRSSRFDKGFDIVVLLFLCVVFVLAAYPIYFVLIASISDPDAVNQGRVMFFPQGFNIEAYKIVLKDPKILMGYYNTIIYTVGGTLISVFITVCAGFALSRKDLYGKKIITWVFLFTMYFNGGLIPTYLQVDALGLTNTGLAIILVGSLNIWNLIVCKSFFTSTIPDELWEAAAIDGCTLLKFFKRIVLPNSKAVVAIMVLYYAVAQWNDYFKSLIYLSDSQLYPLQMILRDILLASQVLSVDASPEMIIEMTRQAESMKYAIIVISSLPVLALYPVIQKHFVKGVMVGSVKG